MSSSALFDPAVRDVPAHDHWHPDIPGVAEILTGGSVRMECQGREPGADPLLCGPLVVAGAEPGDLIVVDVLAVGRAGSVHDGGGHPGIIGCAPPAPVAVPSGARGRDVGGCRIAPLAAGSASCCRSACAAPSSPSAICTSPRPGRTSATAPPCPAGSTCGSTSPGGASTASG